MLAVNVKLEFIVLVSELTLLAVNLPLLTSLLVVVIRIPVEPGSIQTSWLPLRDPVLSAKQWITYSSSGVKNDDCPPLQLRDDISVVPIQRFS